MLVCHQVSSQASSRSISCLAYSCYRKRALSSSAVNKNATPNPRAVLLTALHKTTALVPRVLPSLETVSSSSKEHSSLSLQETRSPSTSWWQNLDSTSKTSDFWLQRLSETYDDLSSSQARPARILVCGIDEWAGSQDLVTAMLEQPFASDHTTNDIIRNRWTGSEEDGLLISYAVSVSSDGSTISVPSPFLLDFPFPVEIEERRSKQLDTADSKLVASIWNADAVIVLCNPLTVPTSNILRARFLLKHPKTMIVYTNTPWAEDESTLKRIITDEIMSRRPSSVEPDISVFLIDPSRAVTGLDALRENPASLARVQRYQDEYMGSRISTLTDALRSSFRSISSHASSSPLDSLRVQRAIVQLEVALSCMRDTLDQARDEANRASSVASRIQESFANEQIVLRKEILGIYDKSVPSQESKVMKALMMSSRQVHSSMDRLTWWRMLWKIDEISTIVSGIVEQAWCKYLEKQLVFQSGRLTQLQNRYKEESFDSLNLFEHPPFNSPVLQNTLQQITSSSTYEITPDDLTTPLTRRRLQIIQYPTMRLHRAGQQAALGMSLSTATGAGLGWAGWVQWLTGSGDGLLGWLAMDATTAVGLGMFIAVAGVRWGVGMWERAKKRWWEDWDRVGEGLEKDLVAILDQTLEQKIGTLPRKIHEGFTELAPKRRDEVAELLEELNAINKTIRDIQ